MHYATATTSSHFILCKGQHDYATQQCYTKWSLEVVSRLGEMTRYLNRLQDICRLSGSRAQLTLGLLKCIVVFLASGST